MNKVTPCKNIFQISLTAAVFCALIAFTGACLPPNAYCTPAGDREEVAVLKAVRNFLDAEIRRDYPAVYACFAPSSVYVRTHTF
ncbi:MAG TPA: hypothetical protein VKO67_09060, partial [Smithellaceae bacterium]|nr:hypothetical protein [Smithellaceae bacterium]